MVGAKYNFPDLSFITTFYGMTCKYDKKKYWYINRFVIISTFKKTVIIKRLNVLSCIRFNLSKFKQGHQLAG